MPRTLSTGYRGYASSFQGRAAFLARYDVKTVGRLGDPCLEAWRRTLAAVDLFDDELLRAVL